MYSNEVMRQPYCLFKAWFMLDWVTPRDGIKKILGQSLNYLENVRAAVEAVYIYSVIFHTVSAPWVI